MINDVTTLKSNIFGCSRIPVQNLGELFFNDHHRSVNIFYQISTLREKNAPHKCRVLVDR